MEITDLTGRTLPLGELLPALDRDGGVLFTAEDRSDVARHLAALLRPCAHPHAGDDGWTRIVPDARSGAAGDVRGFTAEGLSPHTDRSLLAVPPSLLCLFMVKASPAGGDTLLADAAEALRGFGRRNLVAARRTLWLQGAARPGTAGDDRHPVVSVHGDLRTVRYRDDTAAAPRARSREAAAILAALRRQTRSPRHLRLRAGEGYLIHNRRMLHGRTAFSGDRECVRLLGLVEQGSSYEWLNTGFRSRAHR